MPDQFFSFPKYCQYCNGDCDEVSLESNSGRPFFIYPSDPTNIADTIQNAVDQLVSDKAYSWKSLDVSGNIIFCEICKAIRSSSVVVADITTLNFNVLFEIGYTIGVNKPLYLIRDTTFSRDKKHIEELGVLDTIGYASYVNSSDIVNQYYKKTEFKPLHQNSGQIFQEQPLYVLKGKLETEGAVRMMSILKKSRIRFRTFDQIETPRISLAEAQKQINGSVAIVANLISSNREGAIVHNALCAFLCGLAMSQEKYVLMLQEGDERQPIDYRDVVKTYKTADELKYYLDPIKEEVLSRLQILSPNRKIKILNRLEMLDIGDISAENEIKGLKSYYFRTGQFTQARRGHARLIIGRKGTGKTALFYALRDAIPKTHSFLTLDMKPEGYQFTRLREIVLSKLTQGQQEHTMTAFWYYILLTELAHKIIQNEKFPHQAFEEQYNTIKNYCIDQGIDKSDDFSQRLLQQVEKICEDMTKYATDDIANLITQRFYSDELKRLTQVLIDYLKQKKEVWILFDNIDKGWPTRGTTGLDIVIVRSLLEATRKLQRQMENKDIDFTSIVFLRTDIYEHLVLETSDKGKETAISLDFDDIEVFKEIIRLRLKGGLDDESTFDQLWEQYFVKSVDGIDAINFLLQKTLMRPRDLLLILQRTIETAINRGHVRADESDMNHAIKSTSDDLVLGIDNEITDSYREFRNILYSFEGADFILNESELRAIFSRANIDNDLHETLIDVLMWFGFLGVLLNDNTERYSYQIKFNTIRMKVLLSENGKNFVIHPGFRSALNIDE